MKKGEIMSEDLREKVSKACKGKIPWNKGIKGDKYKIHYPNGMKQPAKWQKGHPKFGNGGFKTKNEAWKFRKRIGLRKGQSNSGSYKRGKNHPYWKGGIAVINEGMRKTLEYKLWRKAVIERDNYTCIWCGSKKEIHADHIKPFALYPELRFAIDNGRVLCKDCHRKIHGWRN